TIEYANTVSDLLGIASVPTDAIATATSTEFDNSGETFSISEPLVEQYLVLAETLSRQADLTKLALCDKQTQTEDACVEAFVRSFGKRALRRPLASSEVQGFMSLFDAVRAGGDDYPTSVRAIVARMLVSPAFL